MPLNHNTNRWSFDSKPARDTTPREPIVALGWTQQQWDRVWAWYESVTDRSPARTDAAYKAVNLEWQRRKGSLVP